MKTVFETIYNITRQIPYGRVTTYGRIALLAGNLRWARVVGYTMSGCRQDDIPCHRVVNRLGGLSDSFRPLGRDSHRALLQAEGVEVLPDGRVDLKRFMWYG